MEVLMEIKKLTKEETDALNKCCAEIARFEKEQEEKFFSIVGKRIGKNFLKKMMPEFIQLEFNGYFKGRENKKGVYIKGQFHTKQEMDGFKDMGINKIFKIEYVNQTRNGGYSGDDFAGMLAYKYKNKFLVFQYSC